MIDLRPIGYVIGMLVAALGGTMLIPMGFDLWAGDEHALVFLESAMLTVVIGGMVALACANGTDERLSIQQTFLLTNGVWLALPIFGAIPFVLGETDARYVDAFFEAMSGLTTTGSTVFSELDKMPDGILIWRSLLQWFGGVGIIVVAMAFLPELRIGGMQMFRSEAFDTDGKVLPRAASIAQQISVVYVILTVMCFVSYLFVGLSAFDALNHAFTTIATGGLSTKDTSFAAFQGGPEYVAVVFMILASLPFVRYVQLLAGSSRPMLRDSQVKVFLALLFSFVILLAFYRIAVNGDVAEPAFREALFNATSIMTGTGYSSTDYQAWGPAPVVVFFFIGLIGGCAGSTCCSIKVFRFQLLFSSIRTQIAQIHSPNGIFQPRYDGRPVTEDVMSSVLSFFVFFIVTLGALSVLLGATGLSFVTALSGAATALANVGPGLGPEIGPTGNFAGLNDAAKWILSAAMLVGRLELLAVYAMLTVGFWRV